MIGLAKKGLITVDYWYMICYSGHSLSHLSLHFVLE